MLANCNKPEFLSMAGSTRQTAHWVKQYAHILWEIIGIGEDPLAEAQAASA